MDWMYYYLHVLALEAGILDIRILFVIGTFEHVSLVYTL